MPVVTIQVPEGALRETQQAALIATLTDVAVKDLPAIRPSLRVLIEDISARGYCVGGHAIDVERAKASVPKSAANSGQV